MLVVIFVAGSLVWGRLQTRKLNENAAESWEYQHRETDLHTVSKMNGKLF